MSKAIILGAGYHSKEVLDILYSEYDKNQLALFDNTIPEPSKLYGYTIHNDNNDLKQFNHFYLGIGSSRVRRILTNIGLEYGLEHQGIRSKRISLGNFDLSIDETVDIMNNVAISSSVSIGKGTLLNRNANIHHDVTIGDFCQIGPSAQLLGDAHVGNDVFVGAGAIILPNVVVGNNVIIGAGAVVTKNVESDMIIAGVPAKKMNNEQ